MNQRPLLLIIYAATTAPAFAQERPAADPPQLVAAREENIRATQRALAPVLQNYVAKLTGLKQPRFAPRSQTPFGNALVCATPLPHERVRTMPGSRPRTPPPCETEFRPQLRSQAEFGNEGPKESIHNELRLC